MDWLAHDLPWEGELRSMPTAGDAARRDVPACSPTDSVADVQARLERNGWRACAVVAPDRVVLGLVERESLDGDRLTPVERIMQPGPSTFRPSVSLAELREYMERRELPHALITDSEGRLIGLLEREEVERLTRLSMAAAAAAPA